jgi:predicted nucleic acid-binding Zn ribbon protein
MKNILPIDKNPPIPTRPCVFCGITTSNFQDVNGITCSIKCRELILEQQRNEKDLLFP